MRCLFEIFGFVFVGLADLTCFVCVWVVVLIWFGVVCYYVVCGFICCFTAVDLIDVWYSLFVYFNSVGSTFVFDFYCYLNIYV